MYHLIQNLKDGHLELKEVPVPLCMSGGVLVRNVNSLISIGTEKLLIDFARRSLLGKARARPDLVKRFIDKADKEGYLKVCRELLNRLDEPFPLGYSASGIVEEVGANVDEFDVGCQVAIAGSSYANHAEYNFVPKNLCVAMPPGLTFEEAAFCMVGGIAIQGIREGEVTFGERVAVIGLGLIGLITLQILNTIGCYPIGIDIEDYKICKAKELGCIHCANSKERDPMEFVNNLTEGIGVDCVLICAASRDNTPAELAQKITRQRGRIVLVGVSGINLDRKYFFDKELSFRVSRGAGPGLLDPNYEIKGISYPVGHIQWPEKRNMEYFLQLVADGKVDVKNIITHRYPIIEAITVYKKLLGGNERALGVLFAYPEPDTAHENKGLNIIIKRETQSTNDRRKNVGFIGGGLFTKNILLPVIKDIRDINLIGVATTRGMTSDHAASKFGFSYCTSDYRSIIQDEKISTVFITTRNNLHARFIIEALKCGKDVFVEKPLCISEDELAEIIRTIDSLQQRPYIMVGFNRRYGYHAGDIRKFFAGVREPYVINCRINAGFIEASHWTMDEDEGGGRIIGEICHFVDFIQFVTGSEPMKIYSESISQSVRFGVDDNIISVLKFGDGSVATITYTSKGSRVYPREILEIYQSDSVYYLEDFRTAVKVRAGRKEREKHPSQDMGYRGELEYFSGAGSRKKI